MSNANDEKDKLIEDHEYDGIQELDNPLPGWWLMTFYITIVFSVVYFIYYQVLDGPSSDEYLTSEMTRIEEVRESRVEEVGEKTNEEMRAVLDDRERLERGKEEYTKNCMACHGNNAQGMIGPNLTDDYWIHGDGTVKSIAEIIRGGVPDKGMPAWGQVLQPEQIVNVAGYVYSLHGTEPAGAKGPEGEKVEY